MNSIKEQIETTLSQLRLELAEHGDRVVMFQPYIPLMYTDLTKKGEIIFKSDKSQEEVDRINASPERNVKLSDIIKNLNELLRILSEASDGQQ